VKVRIGIGLGTRTTTNDAERFGRFVDDVERLGFDSLWFSEQVSGSAPDPLVAMAFAAGRTTRCKVGSSVMILPGRNPVLLAGALASLDRLSNGRLLPAFGLGAVNPREQQAFGVERGDRASMFDEALPLIRRLWTEDRVDHDGRWYQLEQASISPKPVQEPIDVWLGGRSNAELRRVGRLGDGWLPSFCAPDDVRAGLPVITEEAAKHDRAIDPEHIGALVAYRTGPLPDATIELLRRRQPDADPEAILPLGLDGLRTTLEQFIDAGASKFVIAAATEPADWTSELEAIADALFPLQT